MLSETRNPIIKSAIIKIVKTIYDVDMTSCKQQNYSSFDDFFTRDFHDSARPISDALLVHPVDGCIVDMGHLDEKHSITIKHKQYYPKEFMCQGINSNYISYYLAPYNHHQIYMPADGRVIKTVYVPGLLHSVQPKGKKSQNIVNFKNERLIIFIETSDGPLILVLVGALLVGSISTNWGNRYHPNQNCDIITEDNLSYEFAKGESIATFHYGSSVILISGLSLESIKLGPCRMGASLWS